MNRRRDEMVPRAMLAFFCFIGASGLVLTMLVYGLRLLWRG